MSKSIKSTKPAPPAKPDPNVLNVKAAANEDMAASYARTAVRPTVQAALTIRAYQPLPQEDVPITALVDELVAHCDAVNDGSLKRGEAMLTAQAHTLDAIFGECARRARGNMGEYPQTAELYLRAAFRAQSQCRATWETLAQMKNPAPVAFVRQANIANGPQQVNNGPPPEGSRAGEIGNAPSKLLEAGNEAFPGVAAGAVGANQEMAPVGEIDGATHGGRQGEGRK